MTNREITIDSFAGGGGASLGIKRALGRCPDVAINHDAAAIMMHAANHPKTKHYAKDVWTIHSREVTMGRDVGLMWCSPDCAHFSRAKGAKPVKKNIRSLAWVVCKWATEVQPRVIILENVREFEDWGPLIQQHRCDFVSRAEMGPAMITCDWRGPQPEKGRCPRCDSKVKPSINDAGNPVLIPDPTRKGHSFKRWAGRLRNLGYNVQWRILDAADFGAPTHRRRLFLIARNDGKPIVWPEATHGDPKKLDDSPLFAAPLKPWRTAAECIDWNLPCPSIFDRKRPLADNTLRRIALGIKRYVLENPKPFIVQVTGKHGYGVVSPLVTRLAQEPLGTVVSKAEHLLVSPFLSKYHGQKADESRCRPCDEAVNTLDTQNRFGLVAATMVQIGYGEREGQAARAIDIEKPLGTVVAGGSKHAAVAAFLSRCAHGEDGRRGRGSQEVTEPAPTVLGSKDFTCVAANLVHLNHGEKQWNGVDEPLRTATTGNHAVLVYSFLTKYFGTSIGSSLIEPAPTATGKDRFGLVTVQVNGESYVIVDIGMRMLSPRELARAQGFPDSYILTGSKSSQVARIGNSVCPVMAEVLVKANYRPAKVSGKAKVS